MPVSIGVPWGSITGEEFWHQILHAIADHSLMLSRSDLAEVQRSSRCAEGSNRTVVSSMFHIVPGGHVLAHREEQLATQTCAKGSTVLLCVQSVWLHIDLSVAESLAD
eukprot:1978228-Amphidinium_carterae.1